MTLVELEHRAVPENGLGLSAAEDEPGHSPSGGPVSRQELPTPLHAEVTAQDEPVLEAQEEVLADGLDLHELAPVEPLGDAGQARARMRRLDLELLADEHLQVARRPMERVAFGHTVASVCIRG